MSELPILDVHGLVRGDRELGSLPEELRSACEEIGFFYVVGHGVDEQLIERLEHLSHQFFAWPEARKTRIAMSKGGRAWRGYFPVGGELTLGRPDRKEGLYFGIESEPDDPRIIAGVPLHGRNLFPDLDGFREAVLAYMQALTRLGHRLIEGISISLGLEPHYFAERWTSDPLTLFRIFHYPSKFGSDPESEAWGVGEHTDYGLLTILWQDDCGGLEVCSRDRWIAAPPIPGSFLCNLGDMLERVTAGRYRSTLHRVKNRANRGRLSFPFFFDPAFGARIEPLPEARSALETERWDGIDPHLFSGSYGEYLLNKVQRVFPMLGADVLNPEDEPDRSVAPHPRPSDRARRSRTDRES